MSAFDIMSIMASASSWVTTQVMMNAIKVPSKRSSLERRLDGLIGIIFCILAALCIVGAIGSVMCLDTVSG